MTEQTNELQAPPAEFRAVIEVIRAGTGKRETFVLTGTPEPEPTPEGATK